jgi:hypothetical protein
MPFASGDRSSAVHVDGNRCQSGGAMACLEVKAVERRGNRSDRLLLVSPPPSPNIPCPSGCLPLTVDPSSTYTRSEHERCLSALGNAVGVVYQFALDDK